MTDIITRLEGAEGADRELAEAVLVALGWEREGDSALRWVRNGIRIREGAAILDPITGPGLCLALVSEKLPGSELDVRIRSGGPSVAWYVGDHTWSIHEAKTLPAAILIALFKALSTEGDGQDQGGKG